MGASLVSDKQRQLLAQLTNTDAGVTRDELAALLGKKQLNPSEVTQLEGLVSAGYVNKDEATRGIRSTFVYTLTASGKALSEG
ncbi:MAG TPA: hypothetical protein VHL11_17425 [Phototrophicaceae bacterium]|nr:hypothetical protein [Phototrophicaceae bacterium]